MSKAFTRENDDVEEESPAVRVSLPSGVPNYLTPDGEAHLQAELATLVALRQELQSGEGEEDQRSELKKLASRIQAIAEKLANAEIVNPSAEQADEVRFGRCVTIRHRDGTEDEYRIVGVNETDLDEDRINWLSPLAKALVGKKVGTVVHFQVPTGERTLEIVRVRLLEQHSAK